MLSTNHSWGVVGRELCRALLQLGIPLSAKSTNGLGGVPDDLVAAVRSKHQSNSVHIGYALPANYGRYVENSRASFIIYNYETSILPTGWAKLMNQALDGLWPSSSFSRQIFLNNGVKPNLMTIIPHGVDNIEFHPEIEPIKLATNKKFKFLCTAVNHSRKGYDLLFEAYVEAFNSSDDVCLVVKTGYEERVPKSFSVDVERMWKDISEKKERPPEVLFLKKQYKSLNSLYAACDAFVSATHAEGFGLPMLEAAACGVPVIAPRYGGHVDFLDEDWAHLIDVKIVPAPVSMQYWIASPNDAVTSEVDAKQLTSTMRDAVSNRIQWKEKSLAAAKPLSEDYSWISAAQQMVKSTLATLENKENG